VAGVDLPQLVRLVVRAEAAVETLTQVALVFQVKVTTGALLVVRATPMAVVAVVEKVPQVETAAPLLEVTVVTVPPLTVSLMQAVAGVALKVEIPQVAVVQGVVVLVVATQ